MGILEERKAMKEAKQETREAETVLITTESYKRGCFGQSIKLGIYTI